MKAKGYGGANVIDAGGAEQGGHRSVPHGPDFATPKWRKLFTHALAEADRLGLELGFNILSGWNLGGPGVLPDQAAKKLTWSETAVEGGQQRAIKLPAPECRDGYYRDVAVVAIPTRARPRSAKVTIAASSRQASHPASCTLDGKPDTYWVSDGIQPGQGPRPDHPEWLELRFAEPVKADRVQIVPRNNYGPRRGTIEAITGSETRHVADFAMQSTKPLTLSFAPQTADRFRISIQGAYDPRFPDKPRNVQVAEVALFCGTQRLTPNISAGQGIRYFEEKAYYKYPGRFTATTAWHLLDTAPESPDDLVCRAKEVLDLTDHLQKDGALTWNARLDTGRSCASATRSPAPSFHAQRRLGRAGN